MQRQRAESLGCEHDRERCDRHDQGHGNGQVADYTIEIVSSIAITSHLEDKTDEAFPGLRFVRRLIP